MTTIRILTVEDDQPEPTYIDFFLHYVDYDPDKINWNKVKQFDKDFGMNLTDKQKSLLHNLQFKSKI